MNNNQLNKKEKRWINIYAILTMIFLIVSFLWLFYDLYAYREIHLKSGQLKNMYKGIYLGFMPNILLYISLFIMLRKSLRHFKRTRAWAFFSIVGAMISGMGILFDIAALSDISQDYLKEGFSCDMEWIWLYTGLLVNLGFLVIVCITIIKTKQSLKSETPRDTVIINEVLYEITQYIGLVSGLMGLGLCLYMYVYLGNINLNQQNWLLWITLSYCILLILPYFLMILIWGYKFFRQKEQLYDEKQKLEMGKAAIISLLVSIPIMFVFYILSINNNGNFSTILWFPFYAFLTITLFSSCLIYYFKRN